MSNNFKNSPIHDKKAIIEMMDELEPKEMIEVVDFIKSKTKPKDMKQTAVEWFAEKVEQHLLTFGSIQPNVLYKFKEEAKEMEKQQIINTWSEATAPDHEIGLSDAFYIINQIQKAEQYYKKTYGGNK